MNWNAILQWSLAQQQGETNKDVSMMPEEERKWLEEALENYTSDEFKQLTEIMSNLQKPEKEEEIADRLQLMDKLSELLDGLDMANEFSKMGGLQFLHDYFHYTISDDIRIECLKIISSSNQNNAQVQQQSGEQGIFNIMENLQTENIKLKEQIIATLSSLIRGECLINKRLFIDKDGIALLLNNLSSQKCKEKSLNIIRDLLYYDDELNKTYHDLSRFQNTSGARLKKGQLTEDHNAELLKTNLLPENEKYKGIVKQFLISNKFYELFDTFITGVEYKQSDLRIAYLDCVKYLWAINKNNIIRDKIQGHLQQLVDSKVEIDDNERDLCNYFVNLLL